MLIAGKIEFRPENRNGEWAYRLRWAFTVEPLIVDGYPKLATPRGIEAYASGLVLKIAA